jgi:hypothetical protein
LAVANYHDVHGRYPPPYIAGPDGRPWHSWRVLILPYIEGSYIYDAYDFAEPWDGPNNRELADRMPKIFTFHGTHKPGNTVTNYLAVVGAGTAWPWPDRVTDADVTDGLSSTILIVENRGANVHWMEPRDLSLDGMDLTVNSPAGVSSRYDSPAVTMIDGSLYRLRPTLAPATLRALFTIRGGEPLVESDTHGWELLPDGRLRPVREP